MFASILLHCSQIRCSLFPTTAAKSNRPMGTPINALHQGAVYVQAEKPLNQT
ncbi:MULTISPECIES: hypothetical protein [unclassified Moorena]|uniref:hypothetical protein n=1 Tax=unclassified Moorena TaxID=2683338 RepID=UPI0013CA082F|nr:MULTISPECIES: hypothetical protein [unclassified Moorena]NEO21582.1 hypothetical protein [Moorena sp. SIO4A5]NEQ61676.1 hypothetical protein [Moorena sp. SIO4A1]